MIQSGTIGYDRGVYHVQSFLLINNFVVSEFELNRHKLNGLRIIGGVVRGIFVCITQLSMGERLGKLKKCPFLI